MSAFPRLKTDAVMQYPASRATEFRNVLVRFLDGGEQRYRDSRGRLRRWTVRLDLLDDSELAALEEFFVGNQGAFASFTFFDPWDEVEYSDCSLQEDEIEMEWTGEGRGRTAIVVKENRT